MFQGLTYLGGEWANNPIVRRDVTVPQLLSSVNANKYPERKDIQKNNKSMREKYILLFVI
jgi:hypothetical protein